MDGLCSGKPLSAFQQLSIVGTGAYGMVYKATDRTNGMTVAIKNVKVPITEDGVPMNTLREIALLKQLDTYDHPNIVRLLDICHGRRLERELVLYLVFEYLEHDLAAYIEKRTETAGAGFGSAETRRMSREILAGVDFLHSHRIVHRDLKPQNLLVTADGRIKLADFGLAKTYDFDMRLTTVVVTLWYRSPEVLLGLPYATPVDIWSVGCIIAELYMLQPLFCGTSEGDQLTKIFSIMGRPPMDDWNEEQIRLRYETLAGLPRVCSLRRVVPNLCDNAYDLIMKMLDFAPGKRINAYEALQHNYFTEEPIAT